MSSIGTLNRHQLDASSPRTFKTAKAASSASLRQPLTKPGRDREAAVSLFKENRAISHLFASRCRTAGTSGIAPHFSDVPAQPDEVCS
jgi:hypothetical protein